MRTRTLLLLLVLPLAGSLAGCGGGGGGGGPDLNGWWLYSLPDAAPPGEPPVVIPAPAAHQGSEFTFLGMAMTLAGDTLTGADPDYDAPSRIEYHLTVLSSDRIEGTLEQYEFGSWSDTGRVVLIRTPPPSGVLTMEGSTDAGPLHLQSSTAFALTEKQPAAGGGTDYVVQILDMHPVERYALVLSFWLSDVWIPPREMGVPAAVTGGIQRPGEVRTMTAGAVTLTGLTDDRIQGEYVLVLGLHGTVEGSFDVPIVETSVH